MIAPMTVCFKPDDEAKEAFKGGDSRETDAGTQGLRVGEVGITVLETNDMN